MQANPNGAVSAPATIVIDRCQRKALLATISNRLSSYEPIYDAIATYDRALMAEARDEFPAIFAVLDAVDYYEDEGLRESFTVAVDARWLEALLDHYEPQIGHCIEENTEWLSEALEEGAARYEPGGSDYKGTDGIAPHSHFLHNVRELRGFIAADTDELAGVRALRAKLSTEGEDR